MRYLGPGVIQELALPPSETEAVLVEAFRAHAAGRAAMPPRSSVMIPGGARFVSFPSAVFDAEARVAGLKWVGISGAHSAAHHLEAVLLLSDARTGALRAILDAQWITLWRTAMVTLIAARRTARADSRRVAFLACGQQAQAHLDLLRDAFPLREVQAYSRSIETAERFAQCARESGLAATACTTMQACVAGADIVISSLPGRPAQAEPCRPEWFAPDSFVALVDLGRAFDGDPGIGFETAIVDDAAQYEALRAQGLVASTALPPTNLAQCLDRSLAQDAGRKLFIPTGCGYLDAALGMRLLERAEARGVGMSLAN